MQTAQSGRSLDAVWTQSADRYPRRIDQRPTSHDGCEVDDCVHGRQSSA